MNIRKLNETDSTAYQKLRLEALLYNPDAYGSTFEVESEFTVDTVVARIRETEDKFTLGAFDEDDKLIGIVRFVRETGVKTRHKANIYGMYISHEKRGQGIGKAILEEIIKIAKETDGIERLYLSVVSDNAPAKHLYKQLGFTTYGLEQNALKTSSRYFDEELMVFALPVFEAFEICPATEAHIDDLVKIMQSNVALYETIMPGAFQKYADSIKIYGLPKTYDVEMIMFNHQAVGFVGTIQLSQERVYLLAFYLMREYQNKGIGKSVLEMLMKSYSNANKREILLLAHSDAIWARRFYEKNGFEYVSENEFEIKSYGENVLENHYIRNSVLYRLIISQDTRGEITDVNG